MRVGEIHERHEPAAQVRRFTGHGRPAFAPLLQRRGQLQGETSFSAAARPRHGYQSALLLEQQLPQPFLLQFAAKEARELQRERARVDWSGPRRWELARRLPA